MYGWMTCDFTSFSPVFQSYQGNGRMIGKALCSGAPFTVGKISPRAGNRTRSARLVGKRLTH